MTTEAIHIRTDTNTNDEGEREVYREKVDVIRNQIESDLPAMLLILISRIEKYTS